MTVKLDDGAWVMARSLVLALVLAFFALSPAAEGFVCAGDELGVAPAATQASDGTTAPAVAGHGPEKSTCPHGGHCHQSTMTELRVADGAPVHHARMAAHAASITLRPASREPESLERPPRA